MTSTTTAQPTSGSASAPRASSSRGSAARGSASAPEQSTRRILQAVIGTAVRAPSVHNTQPWTFVTGRSSLDLRADRSRQLAVLDPTGRQLLLSCGAALLNARVALAAHELPAAVSRFPDPADPDLLARVDIGRGQGRPHPALARLVPVITVRHTNRRAFADEPVPGSLLATVRRVVRTEGAVVRTVTGADRVTVAVLSQQADAAQLLDPAYRAELRTWTTDDPERRDGVPAVAVPRVGAGSGDEVPIRDFDTRAAGRLPTQTRSTARQCLLLLGTPRDDPESWLRAGEALERMLLEIARHGFTASPLTQVVEVDSTRAALRRELDLGFAPHILLRVGRAAPTPGTPRRHVAEVTAEA